MHGFHATGGQASFTFMLHLVSILLAILIFSVVLIVMR